MAAVPLTRRGKPLYEPHNDRTDNTEHWIVNRTTMAHQPGPRSPSNDNAIEHQVTLVDDSLTAELKQAQTSVDGSATQYENGRLRLIPAPSEHADGGLIQF